MDKVWEILGEIKYAFTNVNGSEYYQYVQFYENSDEPWEAVCLDGEFTSRQLRMIADAMDKAKGEK